MRKQTKWMDEELCRICLRPKKGHNYRHQFVGTNDPVELKAASRPSHDDESGAPASQGAVRSLVQGDPILRLVLIRKGILTAEDLDAVETELKGAGIAVAEPMGQPGGR